MIDQSGRRRFMVTALSAAGALAWRIPVRAQRPRVRFAVIGINHGHIHGQVSAVRNAGGEFVSFFAKEPDLAAAFAKRYPDVKQARTETEVLEDPSIQIVLSAGIPNERAPLGVRAMRHGKDFMVDKPGATTLEQLAELRRAQRETKRIFSVLVERHEHRATAKAVDLVKNGAIGKIVQTVSLGPHHLNAANRPSWFFVRRQYGGILCDIASHHVDQFLWFTGSTQAEVAAAQIGNVHHPQYPELEDFGDAMLRGNGGTGYVRVDWFTPGGVEAFGDGRLTILGTDGYIEIRKSVDIAGRPGGSHLFLVDHKSARYIDTADVPLTYGQRLADDVVNRTETANPQAQTFLAMEVALDAQRQARRLKDLRGASPAGAPQRSAGSDPGEPSRRHAPGVA